MRQQFSGFFILFLVLIFVQCKQERPAPVIEPDPPEEIVKKNVRIPAFNRDSAYQFIQKQVDFGPRVPNSPEHTACKEWLAAKLASYGATVIQQDFTATTYVGTKLNSTNIIGQINPEHQKRILLGAHWDTRFIAEEDPDQERRGEPILGADDGASGVGALLEIARVISENPIDMGVDIIFFDAEDQGARDSEDNTTWCLGAQHWGRNLHVNGYSAKFGILLDMVGARGAVFQREETEGIYPNYRTINALYARVWQLAQSMGKRNLFIDRRVRGIIDDHYFVNKLTGIPMIDIIHKPVGEEPFGPHWHTHNDDMSIIDKNVLGSVGQVVLAVLYKESGNTF